MMYTNRQLQDQIFLARQPGLNADEAKLITQYGILNNKSADETLKSIIKQNDSIISYQKVTGQVTNIHAQLLHRAFYFSIFHCLQMHLILQMNQHFLE